MADSPSGIPNVLYTFSSIQRKWLFVTTAENNDAYGLINKTK